VTKIPSSTEGTLMLGGRRVGVGRIIKRRELGALIFIPASEEVKECSFAFTVSGGGSGAEIECKLKFIDKVNYEPTIDSETVSASVINTQESISVSGRLTATDPEGDRIDYIIVSYPKRGVIELFDNGRFRYTPEEGYTGRDKFTYVARDEYGNYSEPQKMKLRITDRMSDAVYSDMEGRSEYNAALAVTAMGIMNGRIMGDSLYFQPDMEVSRAEFVAMAMKALGIRRDSTLSSTFFDDDGDIDPALKGYIATAQRIGAISGDFTDGKLLFSPRESITKYEAAKIMAELMGTTEGEESVFAADDGIPAWARGSVEAMYTLGIFELGEDTPTDLLTRGAVASYLYRLSSL